MLKSAICACLCAVPLLVTQLPGDAVAQKPPNSYSLECVLRSGCVFTCLAAGVDKQESIFEKKSVKSADFIEFNGASIATIFVSNEQPTTFRLSGTVFCYMPNSLVR